MEVPQRRRSFTCVKDEIFGEGQKTAGGAAMPSILSALAISVGFSSDDKGPSTLMRRRVPTGVTLGFIFNHSLFAL